VEQERAELLLSYFTEEETAMNTRKLGRRMFAICLGVVFGLGAAPLAQAQLTCAQGAWYEVPGAGITNGSGPSVALLNNNLHLFVTGGLDRVYTNVYTAASGSWSGWSELPGGGTTGGSGPTAIAYRSDLYVFVLDSTGHIYANKGTAGATWSGWSEVPGGGVGTGRLGAAVLSPIVRPDELELFVRGTDGRIYINTMAANAWSGWTEVPGGGITTNGPAATGFGYSYVYVRGVGGGIFQNTHAADTGNWSGWVELPGAGYSTAAPGVAAGHTYNLVAIRGLGSGLFQTRPGQGANQWTEVPGNGRATATAGPAAVAYSGGFYTFITGPDDRVYCTVLAG
jgi:hypothetical protein